MRQLTTPRGDLRAYSRLRRRIGRSALDRSATCTLSLALACLGALGLAACPRVQAEPRDWAFVHAVGGLRVGEPARVKGVWRLPVRANVAGIESFTNRPSLQNARLKCAAVLASVEGRDIFITLDTTEERSAGSARCHAAVLGHPPYGAYTVFYRGPDAAPVRLRSVAIRP